MNPTGPDPSYEPMRTSRDRSRADAPAPAPSDGALLERMAAGDETALGILYDRWSALVHALAIRLLDDADEAEEIVEATFWQAWRQASRYDDARGRVGAWLGTIARSRALDRLRSRARSRETVWSRLAAPDRDTADAPPDRGARDPLDAAGAGDLRHRVAAALQALPAEQRDAVRLAYYGGFSQSEIAERTGQPLGTVKTRTRLAMDKLRTLLSELRDDAR